MKIRFIIIAIISILVSCNTKEPDKAASATDTTTITKITTPKTDSADITTDTHYFWSAEWDAKKGMIMKKTTPLPKDSLVAASLIQKLNNLYPDVILKFIKVSNDSIFLAVNNSKYLTQQMGSSGAEAYIAEVTYNLTELDHINYVNLRFPKGDHASPGTYARTDFTP